MSVSRSSRLPLLALSSSQRRQRHASSTGGEASGGRVESDQTSTIAQSLSNNIVAKNGSSEPNRPPANTSPFLSIGTTNLIDDITKKTGRPTLQRRRSSRSSNLSLTSIGENEELCASDEDNEEEMGLFVSSATSNADTEGSSDRFAPSPSTFGRRRSTSNITKSTSAPSLFLRRHSSSSILDISSTSTASTISSTTNRDMNKKNFEARSREIDKVGPVTKISSSKLERRLSESDDFIRVEERASRYNELMKKKETARRNSLSLDDSNDQRVDTSAMDRRATSHVSPSASSPNHPQDTKEILTRTPTRRLSIPISITESDDDDNVLEELEGVGMLNIQTAGVGPSSIYHNRRASM